MNTLHPSGEQFELRHGEQVAVAVEVGGAIRLYRVGQIDVLEPFGIDSAADAGHGQPLVPWPNRVEDGSYEFGGRRHQLPINEVDKRNAIHGLLRWRPWHGRRISEACVELDARIHPQPGYPFTVDVSVRYELSDSGLTVTTTATNLGPDPCPYGCGHHPYVSAGGASIDDCVLSFAARTRLEVEGDRGIPSASVPVQGSEFDLSTARAIGSLQLDHAFTDLERDGSGRAWVHLKRPDGLTVGWWADGAYPYLQLFTGDTLPPERARRGLACEPMTCAPNAFNSGAGLIELEPGQHYTGQWGLHPDRMMTPQ